MPNIFKDDFSRLEHEGWSRVAGWYDQSWGILTRQFIEPLLQAIDLRPGMRVLDVACGPGYVSQSIYLKNALPVGVDFSAPMIKLARQLYPQIEFTEGDAQQLDFADAAFDRVVMNFGMLHLSKPHMAIAEACRVLKDSGQYGFTVWAGPEKSPTAKVMNDSIMRFADQSKKMPDAPDHYLFSNEQLCRQTLAENGFDPASIRFNDLLVEWVVPSSEFLFETELKAGVRTAALLKLQTEETLARIKEAVKEGMQQFYDGEKYRLQFCGCVVSTRKKASEKSNKITFGR